MSGMMQGPLRWYWSVSMTDEHRETAMDHRFRRSIRSWPAPPNWSPTDWSEELEAEMIAAIWEAERNFDPTRGVPLESFVQQRVWTRSLSRYRREWAYARRCGSHLEGGDDCDISIDERSSSNEISESLRTCLQRLPEQHRHLIEGLFWKEMTEVEVAGMLCLTQSGISRRKRRVLDQLRRWMNRSEKEKSDSVKD
jgi:RNA polymerase sigma factor (sigma-70 family)